MPASQCPTTHNKFRAIIAEDEHPLAMVLEKALTHLWPELTIINICSEGNSAQQSLIDNHVDVAFLDISMPYKTGLEVAEYCASHNINTLIVLVTAYPEHALDAFKFNVSDYLLKPLCKTRLSETITRLKARLSTSVIAPEIKHLQHLTVQKGNQTQLVDINDVCCFVSEQKYVKVVTIDNSFLISKTLAELEKELDQQLFWRVHRNSLVNRKHIQYSKKTLTGRLELTLSNRNEKLTVSRAHLHRFKAL